MEVHSHHLGVSDLGMVGDIGRREAVVCHAAGNEVANDVRSVRGVQRELGKLGENGVKSHHKVPVVDHVTKEVGEKHRGQFTVGSFLLQSNSDQHTDNLLKLGREREREESNNYQRALKNIFS